jgi:E3 ubiquitin-protein ligase HUWE1
MQGNCFLHLTVATQTELLELKFLEGLFQHTSHCKDFISNSDGLLLLGRLTALPCIPYDFGGSVASDSLVQVIRTMFDAAPNATMNSLTSWVKETLQETSAFWGSADRKSRFTELLDLAGISLCFADFYDI